MLKKAFNKFNSDPKSNLFGVAIGIPAMMFTFEVTKHHADLFNQAVQAKDTVGAALQATLIGGLFLPTSAVMTFLFATSLYHAVNGYAQKFKLITPKPKQ